jgi:hypothetical protein
MIFGPATEVAVRIPGIVVFVLFCQVSRAEESPRVTTDLASYDAHVYVMDAEFAKLAADPHDRAWVKAKLAHMVEVDQYMRHFSISAATRGYDESERLDFNQRFNATRFPALDAKNTADLKALIAIHGWFTIGEFGEKADNDAWLLAQHADQDRAFQREVLALIEPLVATKQTRPEHYAYLFDRLAGDDSAPGGSKPQRYGTQGRCVGKGRWEPNEVEDPANLDQRRASVGLMPEAEYLKVFESICLESQDETLRKAAESANHKAPAAH